MLSSHLLRVRPSHVHFVVVSGPALAQPFSFSPQLLVNDYVWPLYNHNAPQTVVDQTVGELYTLPIVDLVVFLILKPI